MKDVVHGSFLVKSSLKLLLKKWRDLFLKIPFFEGGVEIHFYWPGLIMEYIECLNTYVSLSRTDQNNRKLCNKGFIQKLRSQCFGLFDYLTLYLLTFFRYLFAYSNMYIFVKQCIDILLKLPHQSPISSYQHSF